MSIPHPLGLNWHPLEGPGNQSPFHYLDSSKGLGISLESRINTFQIPPLKFNSKRPEKWPDPNRKVIRLPSIFFEGLCLTSGVYIPLTHTGYQQGKTTTITFSDLTSIQASQTFTTKNLRVNVKPLNQPNRNGKPHRPDVMRMERRLGAGAAFKRPWKSIAATGAKPPEITLLRPFARTI